MPTLPFISFNKATDPLAPNSRNVSHARANLPARRSSGT